MSQPLPGFPTNTSGLFRASPPTQVMTMGEAIARCLCHSFSHGAKTKKQQPTA